jgi:hypothetical protein
MDQIVKLIKETSHHYGIQHSDTHPIVMMSVAFFNCHAGCCCGNYSYHYCCHVEYHYMALLFLSYYIKQIVD